jgi:hypothetical protein
VILPTTGPYQQICNQAVTWHARIREESAADGSVLWLSGKATKGRTEAVIEYDVTLATRKPHPSGIPSPRDLSPAEGIESDHPALVAEARRLAAGTSRDDLYRIYAFIGRHVGPPPPGPRQESWTALETYRKGEGVCGERARLMVALCRAAGIPTRQAVGLTVVKPVIPGTCARATWNHPGISHGWVECYVAGQWEPFDPSLSGVWGMTLAMFASHGPLLYFGRPSQLAEDYARMRAEAASWADPDGTIEGAMSSPLRFVAAAKDTKCRVTPAVEVRRLWRKPMPKD